ncbi:phage portal protein [Rhodococcoides fascians]|uniref:phage portal protein n=1 Tax=Rhodococcoides fascians TaxID=1828 RepID=UPI000522FEE1|nr:phage portal protein [Rhodococcus fascians]
MSVSRITAPDLDPDESRDLALMLTQLDVRGVANRKRIVYFNREKRVRKLGFSVPPQLRRMAPILGWPEKAVTGLGMRVAFEEFVIPNMPNGDDRIRRIVDDNALEMEMPQAHISALQLGPAFGFVTAGDPNLGEPDAVISVRSALTSTALWNRRTRKCRAGLSVIDVDDHGQPAVLNMYRPGVVITLTKLNAGWQVTRTPHSIQNEALVTPLVHQPYLEREFGSSRITQTVMDLTDSAARTMLRAESHAEFSSGPQRYAMDLTSKQYDKVVENGAWQSIIGSIFATELDETAPPTTRPPTVGQFPQSSQEPHLAQLRSIATMFAGETSLPLNSLGVVSDNPASAEAIQAAKEDMILLAQSCHTNFGFGWRRIVRHAVMVKEGLSEMPEDLLGLKARWRDPATPTNTSRAQAVSEQVREEILPPHAAVTYELLGYDPNTIQRLQKAWEESGPSDTDRLAAALSRQQQPALAPAAPIPAVAV